jgi:FtsZ-binding cell division protein ZapB
MIMSELFINYMRRKGLEPTAQDLKDFNFMARVHLRDEVEKLEQENKKLKQDCQDWADDFQI